MCSDLKNNGSMSDELNPNFLFNSVPTELLTQVLNGTINPVELAKQQLANRGLNEKGEWIGFKK